MLGTTGGLVAAAITLQGGGDAQARTTTLRFSRGSSVGHYSGAIRGYNVDRYLFSARAGQVIKAIRTTENVDVFLYGLDDADLNDRSYTLPRSGKYELRVAQLRTFAQRGRVAPYRLTISIK